MKLGKYYFISITLLALNLIQFFILLDQKEKIDMLTPGNNISGEQLNTNCKINKTRYGVSGKSMQPLIQDQQSVIVEENYYCNHEVQRGDIIIYESSSSNGPIIKQIKALPGDTINFKNQNMYINGEKLQNSAGDTYQFKNEEIQYMNMYVQNGILQSGSFFAFGDNTIESIDSRKMGGLGKENFTGKVTLEK